MSSGEWQRLNATPGDTPVYMRNTSSHVLTVSRIHAKHWNFRALPLVVRSGHAAEMEHRIFPSYTTAITYAEDGWCSE